MNLCINDLQTMKKFTDPDAYSRVLTQAYTYMQLAVNRCHYITRRWTVINNTSAHGYTYPSCVYIQRISINSS